MPEKFPEPAEFDRPFPPDANHNVLANTGDVTFSSEIGPALPATESDPAPETEPLPTAEEPPRVRLPEDEVLDPARIAQLEADYAAGDIQAFALLFTHFRPKFLAFVRKRMMGRSNDVIEDVLGEFEIKLFRGRDAFKVIEGKASSFLPWSYKILDWCVKDGYRGIYRRPEYATSAENSVFERSAHHDTYPSDVESPELKALLMDLTDHQRSILFGRIGLGMSAEEVAEQLESTPGAVRVAQHRALARLKQKLRKSKPDDPDFTI